MAVGGDSRRRFTLGVGKMRLHAIDPYVIDPSSLWVTEIPCSARLHTSAFAAAKAWKVVGGVPVRVRTASVVRSARPAASATGQG
jgi:hypothetical protein